MFGTNWLRSPLLLRDGSSGEDGLKCADREDSTLVPWDYNLPASGRVVPFAVATPLRFELKSVPTEQRFDF